jgi:hypothetical protein
MARYRDDGTGEVFHPASQSVNRLPVFENGPLGNKIMGGHIVEVFPLPYEYQNEK